MLLSTHQFTSISAYIDTVLVRLFDPAPLDIAAPLRASELIGEQLLQRIHQQFQGRCTERAGGETILISPTRPEHLEVLQSGLPYEVHYGLILADRLLTSEFVNILNHGVTWLIFDWWQWLRCHVPEHRYVDALMYLSVACPRYRNSAAFLQVGFADDVAEQMEREGQRLFEAMQTTVANHLLSFWAGSASAGSASIKEQPASNP